MTVISKNRFSARRSFMALVMMGSLLPAVSAHAAQQGALGATSTGNITITATIPPLVQISNLSDLAFTNLDGKTDARMAENVCVWSNSATRSYTIRASGNGGAGTAFTLASTGVPEIPYSVAWTGTSGAATGTALTATTTSAAFTSSAITPLCVVGATPTATLAVTIPAGSQETMVANANYTGILTLLVTPQ